MHVYEKIRVEVEPPRMVVGIKARTSLSNMPRELGGLFHELFDFLGRRKIAPVSPPFVEYLTLGNEEMDIEVGTMIGEWLEGEGQITFHEMPARPVLKVTHIGPFTELKETYDAIDRWVGERGYRYAGSPREYYVTDPAEEPDQSKWITLVEWPVEID
jgi:effector-binding domain-containing protein